MQLSTNAPRLNASVNNLLRTDSYSRFGAHRGLALWLEMTSGWHPEGLK
jgi:hypothetical protein